MGRASIFSDRIANIIIEKMSDGESLREICRAEGMPALRTVLEWVKSDQAFGASYAGAQDLRAEHLFQEMLEICDDARNDYMERLGDDGQAAGWRENGEAIRRSQLRIDSRKWILAKMQPKRFGDRQIVESTSEVTVNSAPDFSALTREERAEMRRMLLKCQPPADSNVAAAEYGSGRRVAP